MLPAPRHTHRHCLHHLLGYVYNAGPELRAQRPEEACLTEPRYVAKSQALYPQNHCLDPRIFLPNVWLQLPFVMSAPSFPKNLRILSHKSTPHSQERMSIISSHASQHLHMLFLPPGCCSTTSEMCVLSGVEDRAGS